MYTREDKTKTASGVSLLAGLWLVASPFLLGYAATVSATNDIVIGVVVTILALTRLFMPASTNWMNWLNAVLGLWLITSPFFFGVAVMTALWNEIIIGLLVAVMAIWSVTSTEQPHAKMG